MTTMKYHKNIRLWW